MSLRADAERLQYVAGWSRVVLGLVAMLVFPLLYPRFEQHQWLFGAYVGFALVGQVLIYKRVGGPLRSFVGGLVDMAAVTFLVHRVGSMSTLLVAIYYFAAIVNTLVVGRRIGLGLAMVGSLFYAVVVLAEQAGLLPYGANAPPWATIRPSNTDAAVGASLLAGTLLGSAGLVGVLVTRIREREEELRSLAARLEALSQRDPLTQLFNRRYLMQRLDVELARVRRGSALAVLMIDLDKFKRVNDERGHQMGDEILVAIAASLAEATREVDVPGRYGGDEFVVLLPDTDPASARQVAERLVTFVRAVGVRYDAEEPVTASVGLAIAHADDEARALVQRADQHAYRAKQAGGDRCCAEPAGPEWDGRDTSRVRPAKSARR